MRIYFSHFAISTVKKGRFGEDIVFHKLKSWSRIKNVQRNVFFRNLEADLVYFDNIDKCWCVGEVRTRTDRPPTLEGFSNILGWDKYKNLLKICGLLALQENVSVVRISLFIVSAGQNGLGNSKTKIFYIKNLKKWLSDHEYALLSPY